VRKLDLEAAGAFQDYALAHSSGLALEDHAKLVKWVISAGAGASPRPVPYMPAGFPSRLALLQALKAVDRKFVKKMTAVALEQCRLNSLELEVENTPTGVYSLSPNCPLLFHLPLISFYAKHFYTHVYISSLSCM
jgi:hypothetical protein